MAPFTPRGGARGGRGGARGGGRGGFGGDRGGFGGRGGARGGRGKKNCAVARSRRVLHLETDCWQKVVAVVLPVAVPAVVLEV